MALKWGEHKCRVHGCNKRVRHKGELCMKHWLEERDKKIKKYQKKGAA